MHCYFWGSGLAGWGWGGVGSRKATLALDEEGKPIFMNGYPVTLASGIGARLGTVSAR